MTSKKSFHTGVVVKIILNYFCNLNCVYCPFSLEERTNPANKICGDSDKLVEFFNKDSKLFHVHITGGEPFLYPEFVPFCKEITKKNFLCMDTNLTSDLIYDFIKEINPEKVEVIHCSLHISERKRLNKVDDFIKKFTLCRESEFTIFVNQVMYPPIIKEFDEIFNYFRKNGIIVMPKIFLGMYKGKIYPQSYTEEERAKILFYFNTVSSESDATYVDGEVTFKGIPCAAEKEFITGQLSFKGLPCSAGREYIVVQFDGTVKRCFGENRYLGNIYNGAVRLLQKDEICKALICTCPHNGLKYACGEPKVVDEEYLGSFIERLLEKRVYPYTTPLLRPVRDLLIRISNKRI